MQTTLLNFIVCCIQNNVHVNPVARTVWLKPGPPELFLCLCTYFILHGIDMMFQISHQTPSKEITTRAQGAF